MPITRRKRATPPDQPENNNHQAEQSENTVEATATVQPTETPAETEQPASGAATPTAHRVENTQPFQPVMIAPPPASNGERAERQDYVPSIEGGRRTARGELFRRPPQPPMPAAPVASVPSAPALQAPTHEIKLPLGKEPGDSSGDLLHLAYNPGYTGAEEARNGLLEQLAQESKAGGRARCWNCGSLAIAYDRWQTRSRAFGEVGVAFCEICGVWSVM